MSVARTSVANATVSVARATYTGKAVRPKVTVKLGGKTLRLSEDYTLSYSNNKRASNYAKVVVRGKGSYEGTYATTFTIAKAKNPIVAKAKSKTLKVTYKKLAKKNQVITKAKAFKITKPQGKMTFKKASGNKKITVSSAGKVTVKKGLKKGTYTVKVKVTAKGNANYKAATKTVMLKISVK